VAYVVVIGGVRSTGKSAVARVLGTVLQADVLSSGRVREIIRAQHTLAERPDLFESISGAPSCAPAVKFLRAQAAIMQPSFQAAIQQPLPRKAKYILEDVHFYPGFLQHLSVALHVILVSSPETLQTRIRSDEVGSGRSVNVERVIELQEYFKQEAQRLSIPIIDSTELIWALVDVLKRLPRRGIEPF